jgi:hypothetical protein
MSTMSTHRTIVVKQGDKYATTWTVYFDITGATTRLLARRPNAPVIELVHTVVDASAGVVEHVLDGTLPVADYRVELEINRGGQRITAPTDHYENLKVITDLG